MKKILAFVITLLIPLSIFAQIFNKFSYQAVIRDNNNLLVSNKVVSVKLSLLRNIPNGPADYIETHSALTNANGLITLLVGGGQPQLGNIAYVDWAHYAYYLKSEIDINGGNNYTIEGTQLVTSVPLALYAANSDYTETQKLSISGDTIFLTGGTNSKIVLPTQTEKQILTICHDTIFLTGGSFVVLPQAGGFSGDYNDLANTPSIPDSVSQLVNDAGFITKDSIPANISAFINDIGYLTSSLDSQQLHISHDTLFLDRSGFVVLPSGTCITDYNQLQNRPHISDSINNILTHYVTDNTDQTIGGRKLIVDTLLVPNRLDTATWQPIGNCHQPINYCDFFMMMDSLNTLIDSLQANIDSLKQRVNNLENKQVTIPIIMIANKVDHVTGTTATVDAMIVYEGGSPVTLRGFCIATTPSPTMANDTVICGSGAGTFTSTFDTLSLGTTYFIRAFAVNSTDTTYSNELTFTTWEYPTIVTDSAYDVLYITAAVAANVISDGGTPVLERGICWSTSPNPTLADSVMLSGSGIGHFSCLLNEIESNETFYVRAFATNIIGTTYGNEVSFTTLKAPCGYLMVKDIQGNKYHTVQVGSQCWLKENLKTKAYADGTPIAVSSSTSTSTPYIYFPHGDSNNVSQYGCYYNWQAVMHGQSSSSANPSGVQGPCPNGWHVPSEDEWLQLIDFVSSQPANHCGGNPDNIAASLSEAKGWNYSSVSCALGDTSVTHNQTGFSIMPVGYWAGSQVSWGESAYLWSATENGTSAYILKVDATSAEISNPGYWKSDFHAVRCLKTLNCKPFLSKTDTTIAYGQSITWRGNTYSAAGTYTDSLKTAIDGCDSLYQLVLKIIMPCTNSITDIDGNTYNIVAIGSQCWMAENLKTTHYSDNVAISYANGATSSYTGYYSYPGNNISNVATYGLLYNWSAVMRNAASSTSEPSGVQGPCPVGWHVPSNTEYQTLIDYVSGNSNYYCGGNSTYIAKALAADFAWSSSSSTCAVGNNLSTNNLTGFSGLGGGYGVATPSGLDSEGNYWTTYGSSSSAYRFELRSSSSTVGINSDSAYVGQSIRCIRD